MSVEGIEKGAQHVVLRRLNAGSEERCGSTCTLWEWSFRKV